MSHENTYANRSTMFVMAASMAIALFVATQAIAAPAGGLASRYAAWAGGKHNADALVAGLRSGSSVMLVTAGGDNTKSIAGFTPPGRMSDEQVAEALADARRALSGMGIKRPTAEQIQAALIGGEVALPGGRTRLVQGSLSAQADPRLAAAR
jgi:hypothetical protein